MNSHHEQVVEPAREYVESWHQHTAKEGASIVEHGDHVNITVLTVFILLIVIVVIAIIVGVGMFATSQFAKHLTVAEHEGMASRVKVVSEYKQEALTAQSGYGKTENGKIKLPIARAMELIVREQGEGSK